MSSNPVINIEFASEGGARAGRFKGPVRRLRGYDIGGCHAGTVDDRLEPGPAEPEAVSPTGTAGSQGPLPVPVGEYAAGLKRQLGALPRATITGEVTGVSRSRVQIYFELRDERGGVRCAMWRRDFERLNLPDEVMRDGARIVATGGPDYYPGGRNASPSFSFRTTDLRPAGEGDLIARLKELRRRFEAEGLTRPQKELRRSVLPRRIGVITAEGGAARQDLLVGLERRGWRGEIVWGFAPVQDRRAAPAITRTLSEMAAYADVEAIVVCRGGGSLADLWAFCDEDLCRTVAMLAVPVISAVGHERDVTLLDDVAAVRASTPTHAADAVVGVDIAAARRELGDFAARISRCGQAAVRDRVAPLAALAAGPGRAVRAERTALNQRTREIRAAAARGVTLRSGELDRALRGALLPAVARTAREVSNRKTRNAALPRDLTASLEQRLARAERRLHTERVALRAHDPQRTLERGYARVEDRGGEPVVDAAGARRAGDVKIRFADDAVDAVVGGRRPRRRRQRQDEGEFEQISMEGLGTSE